MCCPADASSPPTAPDRTQAEVVWHPLSAIGDLVLLPLGLASSLITLDTEPTANRAVYLGDLA